MFICWSCSRSNSTKATLAADHWRCTLGTELRSSERPRVDMLFHGSPGAPSFRPPATTATTTQSTRLDPVYQSLPFPVCTPVSTRTLAHVDGVLTTRRHTLMHCIPSPSSSPPQSRGRTTATVLSEHRHLPTEPLVLLLLPPPPALVQENVRSNWS